jgi:hypothetical protein
VRDDAPPRADRLLRLNLWADINYIVRDDERADMFPILMQNRLGYQPFVFPEFNDVEAYTYFTALRPGLSTYAVVADSTALGNYWTISPNHYGKQYNAGVNGDMANDIYLVNAGLVYKDKKRQRVDYASYSATVLVRPKDANIIRAAAPMERPLFRINGRDIWLGVAMGTNEILEVGDAVSTGLIVFPTVPAQIEQTVTWPDGARVERIAGVASAIGSFQGKAIVADRPGVYRVATRATHQDRTGTVFGSGDGGFNHYAVSPGHPDALAVGLPPISTYDAAKILEIPLRLRDGYTDGKVSYSVVFPGMIMDEGEFPLPEDHEHVFRFIPSQASMQFPNFDTTEYLWGKAKLNDSVFFIFFVEATAPTGERVYDAKKVMIREDTVYCLGNAESRGGRPAGR